MTDYEWNDYGRSLCPGCGCTVRSNEFDGWCRRCTEQPFPEVLPYEARRERRVETEE